MTLGFKNKSVILKQKHKLQTYFLKNLAWKRFKIEILKASYSDSDFEKEVDV